MHWEKRLARIQERMVRACEKSGRDQKDVQLIAVSKNEPDSAVEALLRLGVDTFGENRIPQALKRQEKFKEASIHFIGRLQTNKVKHCSSFALLHSLDRRRLAEELNRLGEAVNRKIAVLLQVNVSGEESKAGVVPEEALPMMKWLDLECPYVDVLGLMTMAPFDDLEGARLCFRSLAFCKRDLEQRLGKEIPHLSMGMSGDFEVAIEEGATMIRVGSLLFQGEEG